MIIINMSGGLGNQMFIYATGRALSLENKDKLYIHIRSYKKNNYRSYCLGVLNIPEDVKLLNQSIGVTLLFYTKRLYYRMLTKLLKLDFSDINTIKKYSKKGYYVTDTPAFVEPLYANKIINYYCGIVLSNKVFEKYRDVIVNELTIKNMSNKFKGKEKNIVEGNYTCVHIRRTDYISSRVHNVCSIDYYRKAIVKMEKYRPNTTFLFFSDDIKWVKANFQGKKFEFFEDNFDDNEQLFLMSKCSNFILCNSTFSWWAQYLNNSNNKIIIAPSKWFNDLPEPDLYLKNWVLIDP